MKDKEKLKGQLIKELQELRERNLELEKIEAERKRAQDIISGLYNITKVASSEANLDDLFQTIQKVFGTIVDTTNFFIALYDKKNDLISFPYFVDEKDDQFVISVASKSGSLTSEVMRTGKPLFINNVEFKKRLAKEELKLWGTLPEVWLGVPLKIKNEKIGVLGMQSYTNPDSYSEEDIDLMESISSQIAIAIDHKRTEEEIKLLKEKYEDLYINAPIMYLSLDTNGIIIECNNTILDKLGYTKKEFIGKHMTKFITKESTATFNKEFLKLLKTGKLAGGERQFSCL